MSVTYHLYPERFKIYTIVDTPEEAGEEVVVEGSVCGVQYQIVKVNIYVPVETYVTPPEGTELAPDTPRNTSPEHEP